MLHDMALVTVAVGLIHLDEFDDVNRKFINDVRNLVNAERRDWPRRWAGFRLMGWPEVDVISEADLPLMPSRLAEFVAASKPNWGNDVLFNAHWHIILDCAGLDYQEIKGAFADQWGVTGAVDLRLFHCDKSMEDNIIAIARYAHEFKIGKEWNGITNWWPIRPTADMYTAMAMSGWTRKRFMLNSRNRRRIDTNIIVENIRNDEFIEPMPWLI